MAARTAHRAGDQTPGLAGGARKAAPGWRAARADTASRPAGPLTPGGRRRPGAGRGSAQKGHERPADQQQGNDEVPRVARAAHRSGYGAASKQGPMRAGWGLLWPRDPARRVHLRSPRGCGFGDSPLVSWPPAAFWSSACCPSLCDVPRFLYLILGHYFVRP